MILYTRIQMFNCSGFTINHRLKLNQGKKADRLCLYIFILFRSPAYIVRQNHTQKKTTSKDVQPGEYKQTPRF